MTTPPIISDFASVIQTSLAPVFLLAGTAGFVNIYTTRLGRVSDRLNEVAERLERNETSRVQLAYLRRRTLALEIAVALGVIAGVCTGAATLNLLAGALSFGLRHENLYWFLVEPSSRSYCLSLHSCLNCFSRDETCYGRFEWIKLENETIVSGARRLGGVDKFEPVSCGGNGAV